MREQRDRPGFQQRRIQIRNVRLSPPPMRNNALIYTPNSNRRPVVVKLDHRCLSSLTVSVTGITGHPCWHCREHRWSGWSVRHELRGCAARRPTTTTPPRRPLRAAESIAHPKRLCMHCSRRAHVAAAFDRCVPPQILLRLSPIPPPSPVRR
jgi:hypothetical protein